MKFKNRICSSQTNHLYTRGSRATTVFQQLNDWHQGCGRPWAAGARSSSADQSVLSVLRTAVFGESTEPDHQSFLARSRLSMIRLAVFVVLPLETVIGLKSSYTHTGHTLSAAPITPFSWHS